jgi:hypothetical protein
LIEDFAAEVYYVSHAIANATVCVQVSCPTVLIAYESKQEPRGTQDAKIGKHKTTERDD